MKIGELARETGLSASRIRFYEAAGLISDVDRSSNGYRHYSRRAKQALEIIVVAQRAGFSLDEIRSLLPQENGSGRRRDALLAKLKKKLAEIDALQARLAETHDRLQAVIARIETASPNEDCFASAEDVLSSMRDR